MAYVERSATITVDPMSGDQVDRVTPARSGEGCGDRAASGPHPLAEDGSVSSQSTTIWNGEVGYRLSNKARLVSEAFNILLERLGH